MKKVIITGSSGFIGYHLVSFLLQNTDFIICCLDKNDSTDSVMRLNSLKKKFNNFIQNKRLVFYNTDLKNIDQLDIDKTDIHYIYHLAAESHVDRSISDPVSFVENNVSATLNLLNYARQLNHLSKIIYFSTDEVFGPSQGRKKFNEYDRYNSTNPYSASKAACEEICSAFANTYEMSIATIHLMNVYGEAQSLEKFIPKVIDSIESNKTIQIHTDSQGESVRRSFIDVQDVCRLALFLTLNNLQEQIVSPHKILKVNLVQYENISCLELAMKISKFMDKRLNYELTQFDSNRPNYDFEYGLKDNILAEHWKATALFDDRINEIIRWYLSDNNFFKKT